MLDDHWPAALNTDQPPVQNPLSFALHIQPRDPPTTDVVSGAGLFYTRWENIARIFFNILQLLI
jgi:hypothetical protein